MKHQIFAAALLALAFVGGCKKGDSDGGGEDSDKVASCSSASLFVCREYRGGNLALGTAGIKSLCTAGDKSAVFADVACPTANVIATCTMREGKDFYYKGGDGLTASTEKWCADGHGTFAKP